VFLTLCTLRRFAKKRIALENLEFLEGITFGMTRAKPSRTILTKIVTTKSFMKKTILVCTLLGGVLCQSAFAQFELPETGSTLALLSLVVGSIAAFSWKARK
jgi:hypothetical protein